MRPVFILSLVLALALLHPSASAAAANVENSLRFFCSHTSYFDLCVRSIKQTAPRLKILNRNTILAILMHAVDAKAREGKAFALNLAKQSRFDAKTLELLRDCADAYDTALGNLVDAAKAIKAGDADTRDSMMSSMISNFGSCEDEFDEFTIKSPMADRTKTLKNMVDNCLAIGNLSRSK